MHKLNTSDDTATPSSQKVWQERVESILSEYYFDAQGFTRVSSVIDEATLARLLTKLAVGSATVWWSILEIKEMVSLYRRTRKSSH